MFRKVIAYLNEIERKGFAKTTDPLASLYEEVLSEEQIKIKERSSKISVASMAFIVSSAVVPALWMVFAIIGSFLLGSQITSFELLTVTLIGIPVVSCVILAYIFSMV